jgi:hypothetical protein
VLGHGLGETGNSHVGIARRLGQVAAGSLDTSTQDPEPDQFEEDLEQVRVGVCPQRRGDVHRGEDSRDDVLGRLLVGGQRGSAGPCRKFIKL